MTGCSLWQLLKIPHWTLKSSMRCAKKCFSFIILATAIRGMPTPEICFLPGQFRLTIMPKERYSESLSFCELDRQPSNCEADTLPLSYRHPSDRRQFLGVRWCRQFLGVRWCSDVQLGRYWENKDTRKRIKLALTICRDFMKNSFIRFWEERQYKPKTTWALTFLVCGRMSSLSFVQRTFDWDGWNGFVWREGVGNGAQLAPK